MTIRNEEEKDFRTVEELTKTAFWNVNVPGCDEHYIVHVLRGHPDFVPELDFVLEEDGKTLEISCIRVQSSWTRKGMKRTC